MDFSIEKHEVARRQLGNMFRERRIEMGHSCKATAEFIGISENTLDRIEQGKFNYDIMLLFRICEALEIKPYFVPKELQHLFENNE